jgi:hypothetical protein
VHDSLIPVGVEEPSDSGVRQSHHHDIDHDSTDHDDYHAAIRWRHLYGTDIYDQQPRGHDQHGPEWHVA